MRNGFFIATAFWGFVLGAGFLALGLSINNVALPKDMPSLGLLAAGALVAVVGGLLAAKSYRESRRR